MHRKRSAVLVLMTVSLAHWADAQAPARVETPPDSALTELRERLQGHPRIRVRLLSDQPDLVLLGPRLDGPTVRFERYAPGSWTLDTVPGSHGIPLAEIRRLQVRGSAWDTGAIVGFLVGAATGAAVHAAHHNQFDRGETAFFGLLFGTGGAMAGAAIAAPFHKWHTIHESP